MTKRDFEFSGSADSKEYLAPFFYKCACKMIKSGFVNYTTQISAAVLLEWLWNNDYLDKEKIKMELYYQGNKSFKHMFDRFTEVL